MTLLVSLSVSDKGCSTRQRINQCNILSTEVLLSWDLKRIVHIECSSLQLEEANSIGQFVFWIYLKNLRSRRKIKFKNIKAYISTFLPPPPCPLFVFRLINEQIFLIRFDFKQACHHTLPMVMGVLSLIYLTMSFLLRCLSSFFRFNHGMSSNFSENSFCGSFSIRRFLRSLFDSFSVNFLEMWSRTSSKQQEPKS